MVDIVIVGCGDIGRRIAALWQARGSRVTGIVRSASSAEYLEGMGVTAVVADLDNYSSWVAPPLAGVVLYYLVPPAPGGKRDPRLRFLLKTMLGPRYPRRAVYLSTTGVYGDCHGDWVSEAREPNPQSDRALRRLDAELALRDWGREVGVPVVVLRVPGIYGPGRLPIARLRRREPVLMECDSPYTNRIHADDLAQVCVAAAQRGRPDAVYNVSDGQPSTMTAYFNAVADKLALPRPPVVSRAEAETRLSPGMLSYLRESRRIDNRAMLRDLGVSLSYPSLAVGLESCLIAGPASK